MAHAVTQLKLGVNERTRVLNVTHLHCLRSRIPPPPPQNDLRRNIASRRAVVKLPPVAAITNKRTKRRLLLALVAVIAIGYGINAHFSHHSTVYKGKTIDQWLEECIKRETRDAAMQSLHEAGELAVPDLVRAMTRRESLFDKRIYPKLRGKIRQMFSPQARENTRGAAGGVILHIELEPQRVVPYVIQAMSKCDLQGLREVEKLLVVFGGKDRSGNCEVEKAIPALRQAIASQNESDAFVDHNFQRILVLVNGRIQLENWIPFGTSLQDARHILESHQIHYEEHTDKLSEPGNLLEGRYSPSRTNSAYTVHFTILSTNYNVSLIQILLPQPNP